MVERFHDTEVIEVRFLVRSPGRGRARLGAVGLGSVRRGREHGRIAQLVERLPYKELAGGSSPSPSTTARHGWAERGEVRLGTVRCGTVGQGMEFGAIIWDKRFESLSPTAALV